MLVANISLISLPIVYYAYIAYISLNYRKMQIIWSCAGACCLSCAKLTTVSPSFLPGIDQKNQLLQRWGLRGQRGGQPIHLKNTFVFLYFLFTLFFFNYALFVASILSVFKSKLPLATAKNLKFPMRNEELSVLVLDASQGNLYTLQTSSPLSSWMTAIISF